MSDAVSDSGFCVLGDQPCASPDDPFQFHGLAAKLRTLIVESRGSTPFTIGIEASWGRGKSSLMAQLENELKDKEWLAGVYGLDEIVTANFNAWTAEGDDVLEGLIKTVLERMDPNALRRALRNKRLVGSAKILLLLVAGWLRVGALVNEAWDHMSVDARTRNKVNDLVREAMEDWVSEQGRKVPGVQPRRLLVVFVDDLDRCSPENVLKVFEGLKLYLDAPGFVFVIGYDENVLSQSVADKKEFALTKGRDYVEKIVQIVFRIPQPTDPEVKNLLASYLEASGTSELFDEPGKQLVIDRNSKNPRRIKRFVNRFILDHQLDEASRGLEAQLLIKLLIFETYFPQFANMFTEDDENPIQEFLQYAAARDALRAGNNDDSQVADVFRSYKIKLGETAEDSLARLQAEADERFVALVQDDSFLSLVRSIEKEPDQKQILAKVRRRKEAGTTAAPGVPFEAGSEVSGVGAETPDAAHQLAVSGRKILWIDDHPENNARVTDVLRTNGAQVAVTKDIEEAKGLLPSFAPELLISDIARGGRSEAGFDDLELLRDSKLYDGPALFYASRVSASRRDRALALDASIVTGEQELFRQLAATFAPPPTSKVAPPSESMAVA